MRRSLSVALIAGVAALPAESQQPARVIEFGITGGVSHHDFHYRYPGEGRWQDPLGLRFDARFRANAGTAVGFALVADRYVYSDVWGICLDRCVTLAAVPGDPNMVWSSTAYQVTRFGGGVTWQRHWSGALHGNLGVLAGGSLRQTLDDAPINGAQPYTTREWFAGAEGGVTLHWRDLAFGIGGEYGRVPRTYYALKPYYGRITGRLAYRTGW